MTDRQEMRKLYEGHRAFIRDERREELQRQKKQENDQ